MYILQTLINIFPTKSWYQFTWPMPRQFTLKPELFIIIQIKRFSCNLSSIKEIQFNPKTSIYLQFSTHLLQMAMFIWLWRYWHMRPLSGDNTAISNNLIILNLSKNDYVFYHLHSFNKRYEVHENNASRNLHMTIYACAN